MLVLFNPLTLVFPTQRKTILNFLSYSEGMIKEKGERRKVKEKRIVIDTPKEDTGHDMVKRNLLRKYGVLWGRIA